MIINSNLICSMNFEWENIAVHCSESRNVNVTVNDEMIICGWWLGTITMVKGFQT